MDSKLKNRIITAVILAPLAIAAVFFLDNRIFAILFWIISALALYEWAGMLWHEGSQQRYRFFYLAGYGIIALAIYVFPALHLPIIFAALVVWGIALLAIGLHGRGFKPFQGSFVLAVTGLVLGWAAWLAITLIQAAPDGSWWILWIFGIAWGADVGAYFAGRRFGQRKLAPNISPGKTWEGVAGGMLLAGSVCGIGVFLWQDFSLLWLIATFVLIALSVCGDLFESLVKRQTGVKDSGSLLPGHGGVLDRIDSILIVLPVVAMLLIEFS